MKGGTSLLYREIELNRHNITLSYGASLSSWSLPIDMSFGGSGQMERGFRLGVLCFWFAICWWPRSYSVPEGARQNDAADWLKQFNPESDFGYLLESADISASSIEEMAARLRNSVDKLRTLREQAAEKDRTRS